VWTRIKRALGIDTRQDKYTFAHDPVAGHVATARVADRWVKTTCGYCSVGCGMLVGVKDGKAVTVRGNPDHPVNLGKLCPKGLSEHHILDAPGRAKHPLLRKNGVLEPVSWDEALEAMIENFGQIQLKYGRDALGVIGTGQLVTEEFYTLGKLVQLGFRTRNFDGNTTLCMASAVSGYKLSFGSDGPPGSYSDMETADVILLIGANIADIRLAQPTKKSPWIANYKWPIYFFVAVAFWNLVGAGLFGFLINPPIALYYVQGLNLTPVHGHTALFGVYGMLGLGLTLFCLRALSPGRPWKQAVLKLSFWSLNLGLVFMVILSMLPVGLLQAWASIERGTWYARSAEFLQSGHMQTLRWMRVPGDILFAIGAALFAWFVLGLLTGHSYSKQGPGNFTASLPDRHEELESTLVGR
jgi:hypothetical protein